MWEVKEKSCAVGMPGSGSDRILPSGYAGSEQSDLDIVGKGIATKLK